MGIGMRTVRVGGVWLHSMKGSGYADLTWQHTWPHGSDELTWRMRPGFEHPALTAGKLVELFDGGIRIWRGLHTEPASDGEFAAKGSWAEASGVLALDGSGNATNIPDTAIDQAISRGAVSWTRPVSLSAASWGTAAEPMRLFDLLDQAMDGLGLRWYVDADGAVRAAADPTTLSWYVPHAVAGRSLTLAEDAYYSHLVGSYFSAGPVWATVTVGDAAAAARWGRKEALVDLTPMGVIVAGTATTELNNRLALSGARMGFAEDLVLGAGQLTTAGGRSVALSMAQAGQMVRLMGVTDRTRVAASPVTDVVIAKSRYVDGAPTVQLTPMGKAPRTIEEVLLA